MDQDVTHPAGSKCHPSIRLIALNDWRHPEERPKSLPQLDLGRVSKDARPLCSPSSNSCSASWLVPAIHELPHELCRFPCQRTAWPPSASAINVAIGLQAAFGRARAAGEEDEAPRLRSVRRVAI